jgi:hypothetical protein
MNQKEIVLAERVAKLLGVEVEVVKTTNLVDIIAQLVEVLEREHVSNAK